jgi:outer membrane protein TolC
MVLELLVTLSQGVTLPDTLTLDRALELAHRARGQVVVARAGVDRARADARRGTAVPNPSVKYEHAGDAPTSTLEVIQPLAWLAGTFDVRAAGDASIRRARADSVRTRYALAGEVTAAYYRVLAANEMHRIATQQALAADTLLQLTARRVALGDLSELDRDQASQEGAMLRLLEARALEDARVARITLERAMGARLSATTVFAGRLNVDSVAGFATMTAAEAIVKAPIVAAAVEDSIAASARLRVARWRQLPIPSLLTKWEWGGPPNALSSTIVGFSVPFPLWQMGQHEVALARAEAAERGALAGEARLDAVRRIEEAGVRMVAARNRAIEASDVVFPTAQRLRVGAIRLFDAGRTGIFPVFEAFRREREAAIIMIQELLAMHTAAAELRGLIGVTP